MKQKLLFLIASILLSVHAWGQNVGERFSSDGIYYQITSVSPATVEVLQGTNNSGTLNIPATISYLGTSYTVTVFGKFEENNIEYKITSLSPATVEITSGFKSSGSVNIPATVSFLDASFVVTSIENGAFYTFNSFTSITVPESVRTIGNHAFYNCDNIIVDVNNPNYSSQDGILFNKNKSELIQFPSLKSGSYTIPSTVTVIGDEAFIFCENLTSIIIPASVTTIGIGAFSYCSGLTSFTIPESTTSINDGVFQGCSNLKSVTIPNSVTTIGYGSFAECSDLTSVTFPKSLTSIGDSAFAGSGLSSITFPESLTSIGYRAFSNCNIQTPIIIPESVSAIGVNAFLFCNTLITVDENNPYYSSLEGVIFNKSKTELIQCPTYKSGNYAVPSSVTVIHYRAFNFCNKLDYISLPESVTTIGFGAFEFCSGLISVDIPESVTSINNYLFQYCSGITSINIPSTITAIGNSAFSFCEGLTSVIIPESVTTIGSWVFDNCENLTSLYCASTNPNIAGDWSIYGFNKSNCTLYIPKGSLEAYSANENWQGFKAIIETDDYIVLPENKDTLPQDSVSIFTVTVAPNTEWTASSDQPWLTVTQSTLSGPGTISISAEPNTTGAPRTATITVRTAGTADNISVTLKSSATDGVITITVVQPAMTVTAEPVIAAEPACIFPNPAKDGFSISTSEPCTVDICTQSGAPVKSIALATAGTFRVDGMLAGMYFVTVRTATASQSHKLVVE